MNPLIVASLILGFFELDGDTAQKAEAALHAAMVDLGPSWWEQNKTIVCDALTKSNSAHWSNAYMAVTGFLQWALKLF